MKMLRLSVVAFGLLVGASAEVFAQAAAPPPLVVQSPLHWAQHCASCHEAADSRAPSREALSHRSTEIIYAALTKGAMSVNASALNDSQKQAMAIFLSGRPFGAEAGRGAAAQMPNRCEPTPLAQPGAGDWNGWGLDGTNTRFQPAPGFTADQVPQLTLKWAFGFPGAASAYGQPAVVGGRVYAGSDGGWVYALDARSGCVHWSFQARGGVRTAISVGAIGRGRGAKQAVYFGDILANVYAVEASTGELLWTHKADTHAFARITGAPTLHDGRLYVPMSSLEEAAGGHPSYGCCTFRGSVTAFDGATGRQLWKSYTIPVEPKATRRTSVGTQLFGPAGAAVWSAPTIDRKRGVLYIATGDAYSEPAEGSSDAVIAFDLKTGKRKWARQVTEADVWLVGCPGSGGQSETCPKKLGPDHDFGSNTILRRLPNGKDILTAGQKSGIAWGFDPDRQGAILWQQRVGKGSASGGVQFGPAADERYAFFATADQFAGQDAGGLTAVKLETGEKVWSTRPACVADVPCQPAQPAAVTVMPGVVFAGTLDGVMRAYAADDGRVLWQYSSAREYTTVNGLKARGGALNGPGPVVAGGMFFMNSGYSAIGGNGPGNVLLAFGVD
jgi:polyvinyl alcohol dehydrogenase (cytochrome)